MRIEKLIYRPCERCGYVFRSRRSAYNEGFAHVCSACQFEYSIARHLATVARLRRNVAAIRAQQARTKARRGSNWKPPAAREVLRHAGAYMGRDRVAICTRKPIKDGYGTAPEVSCPRCIKKLAELGESFAKLSPYDRELDA